MGIELNLPLWFHLLIHLTVALVGGYLLGKYNNKLKLGVIAGFLGGFLIDLDHVIEYFISYGLKFNLNKFLNGYQFLESDKVYLIFHAYELVILFLLLAYLFRKKANIKIFIIIFTISGFLHLVSDSIINNYPPKNYTYTYRAMNDFSAEKLLNRNQYQKNINLKNELGL
ncbi:MAG: hypothetical protein PF488_01545 [Patescibacteria group bacterium]|jgi:hypothetical protein|nr:hypothetical protein [Patescibacteria group bacterium]